MIIYHFSDEADLQSIRRAENATHDGSHWMLDNVTTVSFSAEGGKSIHVGQMDWVTEVKPELLESAVSRPDLLAIRALWEYLGYLEENGLDETIYLAAFWEKVLFPFIHVYSFLTEFYYQLDRQQHGVAVVVTIGGTVWN